MPSAEKPRSSNGSEGQKNRGQWEEMKKKTLGERTKCRGPEVGIFLTPRATQRPWREEEEKGETKKEEGMKNLVNRIK